MEVFGHFVFPHFLGFFRDFPFIYRLFRAFLFTILFRHFVLPPIIDAEKLNRGFSVFCRIKLKAHDRDISIQFAQEVLALDEITECYNISGDFDYLLKIQVRDMKHYQDFIFNKLGRLDTIGSTNSAFIMEEIKNIYGINI